MYIYIITSIRLQAQQEIWEYFALELPQNHSKTLRLSRNPLESAAPDPLGSRISISGATGCLNQLLQNHWVLKSAAAEPLGAPLGTQIGCFRDTRRSNRRSKSLEIAPRARLAVLIRLPLLPGLMCVRNRVRNLFLNSMVRKH